MLESPLISRKRADKLPVSRIPYSRGAVCAGRGHLLAIWAENNTSNAVLVAVQGECLFPSQSVPNLDGFRHVPLGRLAGIGSGCDQAALRTERGGAKRVRERAPLPFELTVSHIPELECFVGGGGSKPAAVGAQGNTINGGRMSLD